VSRLTLSLIFVMLLATVGIGWGIDKIFEQFGSGSNKDLVSSYSNLGKQLALALDTQTNSQAFLDKWNISHQNNIVLVNIEQFPLPAEIITDFKRGKPLVLESTDTLSLHYYLSKQEKVLSFTPDELVINTQASNFNLVLTASFYMGLLLIILIWLYPLIKRLRVLRKSAITFGKGDLAERIKTHKSSYLYDIETEFNRMATKIESLINDNKLISSAVSHDLRTPLARLRFGIDILSDTQDPQALQEHQQHLSADIDEMQNLVEAMLDYSKLEQSMVAINKKEVDVIQLLNECIQLRQAQDLSIYLKTTSSNMWVLGDKQYLRMLINNLLINAAEHSNGQVVVELISQKALCDIKVHDNGSGVNHEHREKILKPFVRGDIKENNKGYGMGLAIADRITHWHQGSIYIEQSAILHGALFRVTLPRLFK
jgi:two-component system OmpR family sensor kinase